MAKMTKSEVLKKRLDFITVKEFIDQYHPGLTVPAIHYAMNEDKIDWTQLGRDKFVVLTTKTKTYNPIESKNRTRMDL